MQKYITATDFATDARWLETAGDAAWEVICDDVPTGRWFTVHDAADAIHAAGLTGTPRQARVYARLILRNVHAAPGEPALIRAGNRWKFA